MRLNRICGRLFKWRYQSGQRFQYERYLRHSVSESKRYHIMPNNSNANLGRGHGHNFSSSTYLTTTSLKRCSIEVTANLFTIPMLWSAVKSLSTGWINSPGFPFGPKNENCNNVSKQVRAKSSRNLRVESVSSNVTIIRH